MKPLHHQPADINFSYLETFSRDFFNTYGGEALFGQNFIDRIDPERNALPENLFDKMTISCGFENNIPGFLKAVLSQVSDTLKSKIVINKVKIPNLYIYDLLEKLFPGQSLHRVVSVEQLERIVPVQADGREQLQQVLDQFPVRLSDHVIRQSMVSRGVAGQYLPKIQELDGVGHDITFDGHFKHGILEQMYQNRVVFLLDMHCPVYCRFCFRKHKSNRKEKTPLIEDVEKAVAHVQNDPDIKEILITGGEPLLNRSNLEAAITGLAGIDHVQSIRLATRTLAYFPWFFIKNNKENLSFILKMKDLCHSAGKKFEIGIHLVHPDEISIQSLDIISSLVKKGIRVYVQTPFLKDLNTKGKTLARLFTRLRQAGVQIYYIFTPCSPIHGTKQYWTSICESIQAAKYLREHVSDRCIPKLCTATPLGKIEWHSSGWAAGRDEKDPAYTWIRTPYTKDYFENVLKGPGQIPEFRMNGEGTLDARFRVDMGDDRLFMGERFSQVRTAENKSSDPLKTDPDERMKRTRTARTILENTMAMRLPVKPALSQKINRFHKTSVELDICSGDKEMLYIKANKEITDVVLYGDRTDIAFFEGVEKITGQLKKIDHIVCVRICLKLPDLAGLGDNEIKKIIGLADFSLGRPLRVEVEIWPLVLDDINPQMARTAGCLTDNGVHVYANLPLLQGVNDDPSAMVELAHRLRESDIEFHHIYVAGLPIQNEFEKKTGICPPDGQALIRIASKVRTDCSGREIPLYILQTPSGEQDGDFSVIP